MKSQVVKIQENIPLAPFTTFKIGGPARYFVEVSSEDELREAVYYAKKNNLAIFILGGGSNILVSDDGFNGLVIRIQDIRYQIQDTILLCGAGLLLSQAVKLAAENSLTGLEWAIGIPGSTGGAIRGNAGAYGGCIGDSIENIKVIEISKDLRLKTISGQECKFSYRNSLFKEQKDLIILSAVLKLQKGEKDKIESKMKEIIEKRTGKLPQEPSPGSFFKNPIVRNPTLIERFEKDCNTKCKDNKLPAAWLIEEEGMKGKKIGSIMVSEKHANFVVNTGGGKAQDVVILASYIKQQVRDRLDVSLQEEIQYVGF